MRSAVVHTTRTVSFRGPSGRSGRGLVPTILIITDLCLCEYTSHGHCGIIKNGDVDNDETLKILARAALAQVEAGRRRGCPV